MNTPAGGVQRELADRNTHAAGSPVAKSQVSFAVRHDDSLDSIEMWIGQDFLETLLVRKAQEQAARFAEQTAELLASGADRWRVHNRQQFLNVSHQDREEQRLVGIMQRTQE